MSVNEFWYGDIRLLNAYQVAYYRKIDHACWLQGQYNLAAFGVVLANAFAKKGSKNAEYPRWKDPMEKYAKPKQIKLENNAENKRQAEWFANMLQGK